MKKILSSLLALVCCAAPIKTFVHAKDLSSQVQAANSDADKKKVDKPTRKLKRRKPRDGGANSKIKKDEKDKTKAQEEVDRKAAEEAEKKKEEESRSILNENEIDFLAKAKVYKHISDGGKDAILSIFVQVFEYEKVVEFFDNASKAVCLDNLQNDRNAEKLDKKFENVQKSFGADAAKAWEIANQDPEFSKMVEELQGKAKDVVFGNQYEIFYNGFFELIKSLDYNEQENCDKLRLLLMYLFDWTGSEDSATTENTIKERRAQTETVINVLMNQVRAGNFRYVGGMVHALAELCRLEDIQSNE